jgi:hypothetical protein
MKKQKITNNFIDTAIGKQKINKSLKLISVRKWYIRLWYIISNPFCYIFGGYIRY